MGYMHSRQSTAIRNDHQCFFPANRRSNSQNRSQAHRTRLEHRTIFYGIDIESRFTMFCHSSVCGLWVVLYWVIRGCEPKYIQIGGNGHSWRAGWRSEIVDERSNSSGVEAAETLLRKMSRMPGVKTALPDEGSWCEHGIRYVWIGACMMPLREMWKKAD